MSRHNTIPFNMQTYKEQVKPGMRVYIQIASSSRKSGIAGNMWSANGATPIIRFNDGITVEVTEKYVHLIHLEPTN